MKIICQLLSKAEFAVVFGLPEKNDGISEFNPTLRLIQTNSDKMREYKDNFKKDENKEGPRPCNLLLLLIEFFLRWAYQSNFEKKNQYLKNDNSLKFTSKGPFKYYVIMILTFFDSPTHLIIRRHHFLYPP